MDENINSPHEEIIAVAGDNVAYVRRSVRVSRHNGRRVNELIRHEPVLARTQEATPDVDDSAELSKLRSRSHTSAQVAMFAGLTFLAAGIVSVTLAPDLASAVSAGALSAFGSAVAIYLRTTYLDTFDRVLKHVIEKEKINSDRENHREYWRTVNTVVVRKNDPTVSSIIQQLPLRGGESN